MRDNPFIEHPAQFTSHAGGEQWVFEFPNGYGASVIRNMYSYGGSVGLWEIAVLWGGELTYDTPVTNDVLGHQSEAQVVEVLRAVALLPNPMPELGGE